MDVQEAATFLNISVGTLYHWLSERRGPPCVRLSSHSVRWRKSDIDAWISERVEKPEQVQRRRRRKAAATMESSKEERAAIQVHDIDKESLVLEAVITGPVPEKAKVEPA